MPARPRLRRAPRASPDDESRSSTGSAAMTASRSFAEPAARFAASIGVSIAPGLITLTRTPCDAYSAAAARLSTLTPALAAAYDPVPGAASSASTEEMLMIDPPPLPRMAVQLVLHAQPHAGQAGAHHTLEPLQAHVREAGPAAARNLGVGSAVHRDVQPAEAIHHSRDERSHIRLTSDVGRHEHHRLAAASHRGELVEGRRSLLCAPTRDGHDRTGTQERRRAGLPDAGRATGHEDDPPSTGQETERPGVRLAVGHRRSVPSAVHVGGVRRCGGRSASVGTRRRAAQRRLTSR